MKTNPQPSWEELRAAYRPSAPKLDVASIMAAVRQEAEIRPLRRIQSNPVAAIPTWICATAASLALLAAATVAMRTISTADRQIGQAWMQSVQPEQFADSFLTFGDSTL